MAEEPSWEDIFNPNPTPREPAAPTPIPPLVEPQQAYPPTQAYPAQPGFPAPAAPVYPVQQGSPAEAPAWPLTPA